MNDVIITEPRLDGLNDVLAPAPVPYTPDPWVWAVILSLLTCSALVALVVYRRHRTRTRYKREALRELARIESHYRNAHEAPTTLREIPSLMRWVVLETSVREEFAALTGETWHAVLQQQTNHRVRDEVFALLSTLSYEPDANLDRVNPADWENLITETRTWIEHHHAAV